MIPPPIALANSAMPNIRSSVITRPPALPRPTVIPAALPLSLARVLLIPPGLVSSEQKRLPLVWFQIARPGAFVALPHPSGRGRRPSPFAVVHVRLRTDRTICLGNKALCLSVPWRRANASPFFDSPPRFRRIPGLNPDRRLGQDAAFLGRSRAKVTLEQWSVLRI